MARWFVMRRACTWHDCFLAAFIYLCIYIHTHLRNCAQTWGRGTLGETFLRHDPAGITACAEPSSTSPLCLLMSRSRAGRKHNHTTVLEGWVTPPATWNTTTSNTKPSLHSFAGLLSSTGHLSFGQVLGCPLQPPLAEPCTMLQESLAFKSFTSTYPSSFMKHKQLLLSPRAFSPCTHRQGQL